MFPLELLVLGLVVKELGAFEPADVVLLYFDFGLDLIFLFILNLVFVQHLLGVLGKHLGVNHALEFIVHTLNIGFLVQDVADDRPTFDFQFLSPLGRSEP